jgi:putative ABC transport system ATP-binding protein
LSSTIELESVSRVYHSAGQSVKAIANITCSIDSQSLTVVLGPSGSGKSTLLNLLGGMDSPTAGSIMVDGADLAALGPRELTDYRRDKIGFVFQFYNLVSSLTAGENVALAAQFSRNGVDPRAALEQVGLGQRENSFPHELSGGEMQRVAIARAIAKSPRLLLCDEPTGALDTEMGRTIFQILTNLARADARAVVVVTHNEALAGAANRVIRLRNGQVVSVADNSNPIKAEDLSL